MNFMIKEISMSDVWQDYVNDTRTVCKYGSRCYQKNPEHHKNFKHPPVKNNHDENRRKRKFKPYSKQTTKANIKHEDLPITEDNTETTTINNTEISKSDENKVENENASTTLPDDVSFIDKDIDHKTFEELFLVKMPEDFFKFFQCFTDQNQSIVKTLGNVNLELIGPFDLLLGKLPLIQDKELYLIHWRFFFDPPEFQAVLKKKNSEYHIGYFRDDPKEKPVFLASNDSAKDCHITIMAENIFGAVYLYLQDEKKQSPFTAIFCQKLMTKIQAYAKENNFSLDEYSKKKRASQIVTKTFHGAGIVVPYDKKSQLGYRPLVETDATLKKLFTGLQNATSQQEKNKILADLQPVITYASIAVDECDFGTGLEAGINLFCSGLKELEPNALSSLCTAYNLLNREVFSRIIKAHLKNRRKGPNMSLLSIK